MTPACAFPVPVDDHCRRFACRNLSPGGDSDVTFIYVAQDYDLTLHPLTWTGGPLPNYHEERLLNGLRKWASNPTKSLSLAVFFDDSRADQYHQNHFNLDASTQTHQNPRSCLLSDRFPNLNERCRGSVTGSGVEWQDESRKGIQALLKEFNSRTYRTCGVPAIMNARRVISGLGQLEFPANLTFPRQLMTLRSRCSQRASFLSVQAE